jgi:hypothetical protein
MRCQTPQVVNVFTRWRPSFACLAMSLSTLDFFILKKNYERSLLLHKTARVGAVSTSTGLSIAVQADPSLFSPAPPHC